MNFSLDSIRFRINVEFPDCDVDAVFTERRMDGTVLNCLAGAKHHKISTQKTPIANSVDSCLAALRDSPDLAKIGVSMVEWYGLMMGCCAFTCEVQPSNYHPELPQQVTAIARKIFAKRIRYYKHQSVLSN